MESTNTIKNIEDVKKELFANVMKGDWKEVVRKYKEDGRAHKLKISRSGHTALHLAVSDAGEDVVEEMVDAIKSRNSTKDAFEALSIGNERGHTALHFAAALGNLRMCKCIASVDPLLVGVRNNEGETPLFWAVLYGAQPQAFFCLYKMCSSTDQEAGYSYCRREDGQTILHCAIFAEEFELALQIISLYKGRLVNLGDEDGISPLHTLASKPSCFRSGTNYGRWGNIFYNCIYVEHPKMKPLDANDTENSDDQEHQYSYPENYQALVNFILVMKKAFQTVTTIGLARARSKTDTENPDDQEHKDHTGNQSLPGADQGPHDFIPANNVTCFEFGRSLYKAFLVIVGCGHSWINKIREEKKKHLWAVQVVDKLLEHSNLYANEDAGGYPSDGADGHCEITSSINEEEKEEKEKKSPALKIEETAILVAAKNGVSEIVDRILQNFPVAIHDENKDRKNILLLATENRQLEVYKLLLKRNVPRALIMRKVDEQGNTALHLAATLNPTANKLWPIPGAALQLQWEIKWYKFAEKSMPPRSFLRPNKEGETPEEIFSQTHKELVKAGSKWLTTTSSACSLVATLIATVAFASCTTFPGGTDERSGKPKLENQPTFNLFMSFSLIALCSSVTSLVMFLSILTSRHQEKDFSNDLPKLVLVGLTSLFISIVSILTSFCSGHHFVLEEKLKNAVILVYTVTFLPISLFAAAQFPLYLDLLRATFGSPF
ncbi:hypothetical protein L484_002357 [Morus notabilis]|uniref:PGG domain-containing protein n=1 Tax=Morus notabilis TaxID=981085 RepID=W9RA07_9ROSA|nr:hypothetical protein L484_002357 [Morus notabilis]